MAGRASVDSDETLREGAGVTWERRLFDVFDDLEQQADGLARRALDEEVAELGRAEYAEVDLVSRLHGSLGADLVLTLTGVTLQGRLVRAGRDWCLLEPQGSRGQEWLVALRQLMGVRGLTERSVPESVRPVVARLSLTSALRALAETGEAVLVVRVDGSRTRGWLGRVGSDFVELRLLEEGVGDRRVTPVEVLPLAAVVALQPL